MRGQGRRERCRRRRVQRSVRDDRAPDRHRARPVPGLPFRRSGHRLRRRVDDDRVRGAFHPIEGHDRPQRERADRAIELGGDGGEAPEVDAVAAGHRLRPEREGETLVEDRRLVPSAETHQGEPDRQAHGGDQPVAVDRDRVPGTRVRDAGLCLRPAQRDEVEGERDPDRDVLPHRRVDGHPRGGREPATRPSRRRARAEGRAAARARPRARPSRHGGPAPAPARPPPATTAPSRALSWSSRPPSLRRTAAGPQVRDPRGSHPRRTFGACLIANLRGPDREGTTGPGPGSALGIPKRSPRGPVADGRATPARAGVGQAGPGTR